MSKEIQSDDKRSQRHHWIWPCCVVTALDSKTCFPCQLNGPKNLIFYPIRAFEDPTWWLNFNIIPPRRVASAPINNTSTRASQQLLRSSGQISTPSRWSRGRYHEDHVPTIRATPQLRPLRDDEETSAEGGYISERTRVDTWRRGIEGLWDASGVRGGQVLFQRFS